VDLSDQKTQIMLIGVLAVLGLIYVWFTYMFSPRNEQIGELEGQVTELTSEIQQLEVRVRQLDRVEAQLQELQVQWEETLKSFPTEAKEEEILGNIMISEQNSGLYITGIQKEGRRDRGLYIEEDYSISMLGRYDEMESFIRQLVSMPRRMTVNYMQLVHPGQAGGGGAAPGGDGGGPPPQADEVVISCTITTYQVKEGG